MSPPLLPIRELLLYKKNNELQIELFLTRELLYIEKKNELLLKYLPS